VSLESSFCSLCPLADTQLACSRHPAQEIIQKQIEEHKAYELKTEYSKEKYLKKKEAKSVLSSHLLRSIAN